MITLKLALLCDKAETDSFGIRSIHNISTGQVAVSLPARRPFDLAVWLSGPGDTEFTLTFRLEGPSESLRDSRSTRLKMPSEGHMETVLNINPLSLQPGRYRFSVALTKFEAWVFDLFVTALRES